MTIHKTAVLIASYKRFTELQHQIYTMLNQDEPPAKIFVAVKGFPECFVNQFLQTKFERFPSVIIKCTPNKNQLSNLLDCVRDEDTRDIDYFLKIDDDDYYPAEYLSLVKLWLARQREINPALQGHGIVSGYNLGKNGADMYIFPHYHAVSWGGTLGFTPQVLDCLFKVESKDEETLQILGKNRLAVDQMIMFFCKKLGGFYTHRERENFIYSVYNPSCWRQTKTYLGLPNNIFVSSQSRQHAEEHFVWVRHPHWSDTLRLYGNDVHRISKPAEKGTFTLSGNILTVKWEKYAEEKFIYQEQGGYFARKQKSR